MDSLDNPTYAAAFNANAYMDGGDWATFEAYLLANDPDLQPATLGATPGSPPAGNPNDSNTPGEQPVLVLAPVPALTATLRYQADLAEYEALKIKIHGGASTDGSIQGLIGISVSEHRLQDRLTALQIQEAAARLAGNVAAADLLEAQALGTATAIVGARDVFDAEYKQYVADTKRLSELSVSLTYRSRPGQVGETLMKPSFLPNRFTRQDILTTAQDIYNSTK